MKLSIFRVLIFSFLLLSSSLLSAEESNPYKVELNPELTITNSRNDLLVRNPNRKTLEELSKDKSFREAFKKTLGVEPQKIIGLLSKAESVTHVTLKTYFLIKEPYFGEHLNSYMLITDCEDDNEKDLKADCEDTDENGKATREGQSFVVNGRKYLLKENGTLAPISGAGLHTLDRNTYKALAYLKEFNNLEKAKEFFKKSGAFSESSIEDAEKIWRMYR